MAKNLLNQKVLERKDFILDIIFKQWMNILNPDPQHVSFLMQNATLEQISFYLSKIQSDRAGISWSTHGHTSADTMLYAYGKNSQELKGNYENIEINKFISSKLNLKLDQTTKQLNSNL
jgi:alkaline phosphatase